MGEAVTLAGLEADPHPLLASLRRHEPVSRLPALNGWLVTSRELALRVLRDSAALTVDDPRFSTARVVGPSMLSLDGAGMPGTVARSAAASAGMRSTPGWRP